MAKYNPALTSRQDEQADKMKQRGCVGDLIHVISVESDPYP